MPGNNRLIAQGLTDIQAAFVREYVNCAGDGSRAVELANLPGPPHQTAWRLLHTPVVVAAIQAAVALKIRTEGASVAQRVLLEIARDDSAPKGVRVDAAKTLLDRAGIVAAKAPEKPGERPLSDYSVDELQALIPKLEAERAAAARDVTPETAREADQDAEDAMFS